MDIQGVINIFKTRRYVSYREGKEPEVYKSEDSPATQKGKEFFSALLVSLVATAFIGFSAKIASCAFSEDFIGNAPPISFIIFAVCFAVTAIAAAARQWLIAMRWARRAKLYFEVPEDIQPMFIRCKSCDNLIIAGMHMRCPYCKVRISAISDACEQ